MWLRPVPGHTRTARRVDFKREGGPYPSCKNLGFILSRNQTPADLWPRPTCWLQAPYTGEALLASAWAPASHALCLFAPHLCSLVHPLTLHPPHLPPPPCWQGHPPPPNPVMVLLPQRLTSPPLPLLSKATRSLNQARRRVLVPFWMPFISQGVLRVNYRVLLYGA